MCLPTMWHPGKCRPRRALAAPLQAKKPQMPLSQQLNTHRLFKRPSKAPTRPRVCAGRSEPLLVSHTTLWKPHVTAHSVNSLTIIDYSSDHQRLRPDRAYAQAGLSPCWSHIPHCGNHTSRLTCESCISHSLEISSSITCVRRACPSL